MNQDWDIKSRSEICQACQGPFEDRQSYYTCLAYTESGYARTDFCEACWQPRKDERAGCSVWRGVFRVPPPLPEPIVKRETAESLFRELADEGGGEKATVLYILAVMLERRRLLVERDVRSRDDGGRVLVYEHRKTGETFLVSDPGLQLGQLEHVQAEVLRMLGGQPRDGDASEESAPGTASSDADPRAQDEGVG